MRYAALFISMLLLVQPAGAATTPEIDPRASLSVVQQWIYNYRAKPDYAHVPAAVRVQVVYIQMIRTIHTAGKRLGTDPGRARPA